MSFKRRVGFNVMMSLDPGYLNAGLMKPWRGFTPVAGKKNWRGKDQKHLDRDVRVWLLFKSIKST
jgi:hypothetical protein